MNNKIEAIVNKVIQGDSLEVMWGIPDKSVDLVLTDPPYGTTACTWDSVIPFEPMWEQLKRITKKNGAIVLFGSQPFTSALVMSNPKMFKYEWVWEKSKATGHLLSRTRPLKIHENILVFYEKQPTYNPQGVKSGIYKTGRTLSEEKARNNVYGAFKNGGIQNIGNFPKSNLKINNPSNHTNIHPTQKSVALMEYLIKTYTNEGDLVLDFAMGSGTTAVAAKELGRNFIGIEKDKTYCEIARRRLAQGVFEDLRQC